MSGPAAPVSIALEHWSLHKGLDQYQLLAQIRPTDAFDSILLHRIGQEITRLMESVVNYDGRVLADVVKIEVAWLRSEWRWLDDGSLWICKQSVAVGQQADDVMVVATAPLIVAGGVR